MKPSLVRRSRDQLGLKGLMPVEAIHMTSACVKWGHALGFSGSLGEFDKLSLNFEVKVTSPRSKLPRGALSVS